MRCKSEETMEQIKNAVEEFYFSHYRSLSIGELAAEVGYAKSTVHSYLWEMDRRGRGAVFNRSFSARDRQEKTGTAFDTARTAFYGRHGGPRHCRADFSDARFTAYHGGERRTFK